MSEEINAEGGAIQAPTLIDKYLRLAMVSGLLILCGWIVGPFAGMIVWGALIAVAAHPIYEFIRTRIVRGRPRVAAFLFGFISLALLTTPVALLSVSAAKTAEGIMDSVQSGDFHVPAPPEMVRDVPLVGERVFDVWTAGSVDLSTLMQGHTEELQDVSGWLLSGVGAVGLSIIQMLAAIIISALILANSGAANAWSRRLARRAAGARGNEFADAASDAVRSVTRGILGVAVIQALLCGVGFLAVDLPAAGAWAFAILLFAIVQLPPSLILLPIVLFIFDRDGAMVGTLFAVWCAIAGFSDTVLKPLLLGRGSQTSMGVLFVGSLGGFMAMGLIGLFLGAVILVLGNLLLQAWLEFDDGLPASADLSPAAAEQVTSA